MIDLAAAAAITKRYRVQPETVALWSRMRRAFGRLCIAVSLLADPEARELWASPEAAQEGYRIPRDWKDALVVALENGEIDLVHFVCDHLDLKEAMFDEELIVDASGEARTRGFAKREERLDASTVIGVASAIVEKAPAGVSFASVRWIAWRTQFEERTVLKVLEVLQRHGWIGRLRRDHSAARQHQEGPGWSSKYRTSLTVLTQPTQPAGPAFHRVAKCRSTVEREEPAPASAPGGVPPVSRSSEPPPPPPPGPAPEPPATHPMPRSAPTPPHAEAILRELRSYPDLEPLHTPDDARAIASAAAIGGVPLDAVNVALRQLAMKVHSGVARPTRATALGFIGQMIGRPVADAASAVSSSTEDSAPRSRRSSAALLGKLAETALSPAKALAAGLTRPWGELPPEGVGVPAPDGLREIEARAAELERGLDEQLVDGGGARAPPDDDGAD